MLKNVVIFEIVCIVVVLLCLSMVIMLVYNVNVVYIRMNYNDEKVCKKRMFYKTLNLEDVNK